MIIFITGTGGAGKSTLIEGLKRILPVAKYDIHDIDEADLWGDDENYKAWKQAKIEYYLERSKKNDQKGIDTILAGIIFPQNVLNSEVYSGASARFILLDSKSDSIADRLLIRHKRATAKWLSEAKKGHQETASSLRMRFSDNPGVELREKPKVDIVETSEISPQAVLNQVTQLIKEHEC